MHYSLRPFADEKAWEAFIEKHSPGALFQSYLWGEVLRRGSVAVERFGVYRNGTLEGVFQTAHILARRGRYLHVRHGPVFSGTENGAWPFVLSALKDMARRKRMMFVRLNPLITDSPFIRRAFAKTGAVPSAIHRMDAEHCWVLDLTQSEDELLSGMRKSTRYEIRRADKEGVTVRSGAEESDMDAFMDLYSVTSRRHGFVPHSGVRHEFDVFAKKGRARLYLGSAGGQPVSGAIIIYQGDQAIYHHGASIPHKLPVSHAVQWTAIREAKARGCRIYNFWGIAPENAPTHPWNGITVFKKGFGGREMEYIHAHDFPVSPWYFIPRTVESLRRRMRGYD